MNLQLGGILFVTKVWHKAFPLENFNIFKGTPLLEVSLPLDYSFQNDQVLLRKHSFNPPSRKKR